MPCVLRLKPRFARIHPFRSSPLANLCSRDKFALMEFVVAGTMPVRLMAREKAHGPLHRLRVPAFGGAALSGIGKQRNQSRIRPLNRSRKERSPPNIPSKQRPRRESAAEALLDFRLRLPQPRIVCTNPPRNRFIAIDEPHRNPRRQRLLDAIPRPAAGLERSVQCDAQIGPRLNHLPVARRPSDVAQALPVGNVRLDRDAQLSARHGE